MATNRQLRNLQAGTAFRVELEPGRTVTGRLLYANACRAYVEIDGPPVRRQFTAKRTGKTVEFTAPGTKRTSWPIELEVEVNA